MKLISLVRNLAKNWKGNMVALAGLSLGMMVAILSVSYIIFESSYDTFHSKSDRIYTVYTKFLTSGSDYATSFASESGLKDYAISHVPLVSSACRIKGFTADMEVDNNTFKEIHGYYSDPEIFDIFDLPLINGSKDALSEPGKIILSKRLSERLFGSIDCYNRILSVNEEDFTVAGVIENPPINSNLDFDFLASLNGTTESSGMDPKSRVNLYILTSSKPDSTEVVTNVLDNYYLSAGRERESNTLIALGDLHQYGAKTTKSFLIFISISILVLFTSIVNYVNIHYARMETRTKELGMRKVNGASRWSIVGMVISESLLVTLLASIIGLILSEIFLDQFQNLTSVKVQQYGPGLWKIQAIIVLITLILGVSAGMMTSGRYSAISPIKLLRGTSRSGSSIYIRKILIGFQFAISGGMAALMLIFFLQLKHLANADMGFEPENRLLITLSESMENRYDMIRDEVLNIPGVDKVTGRKGGFGRVDLGMTVLKGENLPENHTFVLGYVVEDDFFDTYGIDLLDGKTFRDFSGRDSSLIVLDKYTASQMKLENPVGTKLKAYGMTVEVIGLVDDADFIALNSKRMPRIYCQFARGCSELTVKYSGKEEAVLKEIDGILTRIDPEYKLEYKSLEEAVSGLYSGERNLFRIISICGLIAIALSLTGAYAMAAYLAERRVRQNSIRRVMGATGNDITLKSMLEIAWPVMIGSLISWPAVYFIAQKWLENFTDRMEIGLFPFLASFAVVSLLVVATVFAISRRAALRNPAEMLRQE